MFGPAHFFEIHPYGIVEQRTCPKLSLAKSVAFDTTGWSYFASTEAFLVLYLSNCERSVF